MVAVPLEVAEPSLRAFFLLAAALSGLLSPVVGKLSGAVRPVASTLLGVTGCAVAAFASLGVVPQALVLLGCALAGLASPWLVWDALRPCLAPRGAWPQALGASLAAAGVVLLVFAVLPHIAVAVAVCLMPLVALALSGALGQDVRTACPLELAASPLLLAGGAVALAASGLFSGLTWSSGHLDPLTIGAGAVVAGALLLGAAHVFTRQPAGVPWGAAVVALIGVQAALHLASGIGAMLFAVSDALYLPQHAVYHALELLTFVALLAACLQPADAAGDVRKPAFCVALFELALAAGTAAGMFFMADTSFIEMVTLGLYVLAVIFVLLGVLARPAGTPVASDEALPHAAQPRELDTLAQVYGLTAREREVLGLWMTGHRVDYVAGELGVSVNTAKTHIGHIYKKTGVSSREDLLLLAKEHAGQNP